MNFALIIAPLKHLTSRENVKKETPPKQPPLHAVLSGEDAQFTTSLLIILTLFFQSWAGYGKKKFSKLSPVFLIGAKDFSSEGGKVFCVDFSLTELQAVFFMATSKTVHTGGQNMELCLAVFIA